MHVSKRRIVPHLESANGRCTIYLGDCRDVLATLASGSVDAVVCDPPYPFIVRSYGRWTEEEWFVLMRPVVTECMRVLKPSGSALFILAPNSERVGKMRTWLWEFMLWVGKEWGIVQDAWWWNTSTPPGIHSHRDIGLLRPSLKACVWVGPPDCYRDQVAVLWEPSDSTKATDLEDRALRRHASGWTARRGRAAAASIERGGTTPYNLLPIGSDNQSSDHNHGACTPSALCRWWVRYLCPVGGIVLDPFMGSGTVPIVALREGRSTVGIEVNQAYCDSAIGRIRLALGVPATPMIPERI